MPPSLLADRGAGVAPASQRKDKALAHRTLPVLTKQSGASLVAAYASAGDLSFFLFLVEPSTSCTNAIGALSPDR